MKKDKVGNKIRGLGNEIRERRELNKRKEEFDMRK